MHSLDSANEQQEGARGDGEDFQGFQNQEPGLARSDPYLKMRDQYASEEQQLHKMAYDSHFAEDINMRMRIPTKLTVASHGTDDDFSQWSTRASNGDILSKMEVPDRIVISVGENGTRYGGAQGSSGSLYAENYLVDGPASEHLFLTTPPRKLTLAERNLDALDMPEHEEAQSQQQRIGNKSSSEDIKVNGEVDLVPVEHCTSPPSPTLNEPVPLAQSSGLMSDFTTSTVQFYQRVLQAFDDNLNSRPITHADDSVQTGISAVVTEVESVIRMNGLVSDPQQNDSSEELDDVSLLRSQIFKLHRRITAIEKQQTERSKRDICIYAVTIAFWVLNGWFLFSSRRPY